MNEIRPEVMVVPCGETKSSFIKVRLNKIKNLEESITALVKDAECFDENTEIRIKSLLGLIKLIKGRVTEIKK